MAGQISRYESPCALANSHIGIWMSDRQYHYYKDG